MNISIFETAKEIFQYEAFLEMAEELNENNQTTGENQSEMYLHYTNLNLHRMKRWNKSYAPNLEVVQALIASKVKQFRVITEIWCGDSAQNLPVFAALAKEAKIPLKIVLRDDNPEIMSHFLTNNAKSIPVMVAFDAAGEYLFKWGPRPDTAQEMMVQYKLAPEGKNFDEFELELHKWYTKDKGAEVASELLTLLNTL